MKKALAAGSGLNEGDRAGQMRRAAMVTEVAEL